VSYGGYRTPEEWLDAIIKGGKLAKESIFTLKYRVSDNGVSLTEMEVESDGQIERFPVERAEKDHVPFILYRLRGTKGVCLIEDRKGRRYLPRIIVRAMEMAGRKIRVIACAPSLAELKAKGY